MSNDSTLSFDRMRGMLMRAAEIRDSEQQQIFDSLDEIHARLAALDALGTVRKRLTELPDRTEVSVLAERLDDAVAKLDAQDAAISSVLRAVEAMPDKMAKPIAQLDGRLDGMAGRLEGVSGRMDGLDDRLGGLHKRLDDLDNRLDRHEMRLDAMPSSVGTPIKERIDGVERMVREQLEKAVRSVDVALPAAEGQRMVAGEEHLDPGAGELRDARGVVLDPAVPGVGERDPPAEEDEVAAEEDPPSAAVDREREVRVRVARRLDRLDDQVADPDPVAVPELPVDRRCLKDVIGRIELRALPDLEAHRLLVRLANPPRDGRRGHHAQVR